MSSRAGLALAALATLAALQFAASALLPTAYAVFCILLLHPLYVDLARTTRRGLANLACISLLLLALTAFGGSLWFAADALHEYAQDNGERIAQARAAVAGWLEALAITPLPWWSADPSAAAGETLWRAAKPTVSALGGLILVLALVGFGLPQADLLGRRKLVADSPQDWSAIAAELGHNVRRYFLARTVAGLLTGTLVALAAWMLGLEMPLVWGLTNFALNYIPTIGSLIGVIPPTLFAIVQYQTPEMTLLTLGIVGGIQLLMGNAVDPYLQSRYVNLSGFAVLLSVLFWGFMWGPAGAFIGVPMAIAAVIIGRRFPGASDLVRLLERRP